MLEYTASRGEIGVLAPEHAGDQGCTVIGVRHGSTTFDKRKS